MGEIPLALIIVISRIHNLQRAFRDIPDNGKIARPRRTFEEANKETQAVHLAN